MDALEELVAFVNADLESEDRRDWLIRLWAVADPPTREKARHMPEEVLRPERWQVMRDLRQLQQDLRRWFTDLRESVGNMRRLRDGRLAPSTLGLTEGSYVRMGRPQIAVRVDPTGRRVRLITIGDLRSRVLLRAQSLLVEQGPSAIRACPGCPRWIVGVGRRQYCTPTCRNAHYWRNLPPARVERYRRTQYDKFGWTHGARSRDAKARESGDRPRHPR
jgi:hypothetical protein